MYRYEWSFIVLFIIMLQFGTIFALHRYEWSFRALCIWLAICEIMAFVNNEIWWGKLQKKGERTCIISFCPGRGQIISTPTPSWTKDNYAFLISYADGRKKNPSILHCLWIDCFCMSEIWGCHKINMSWWKWLMSEMINY